MSVTIIIDDCISALEKMDADSVDCVVTSPPYWGLRDYGVDGQLGLESTLAEHLQKMVEVFDAVKRVLKPTGTCWVNYGDCYATAPHGRSTADINFKQKNTATCLEGNASTKTRGSNPGNKQKSKPSNYRIMAGGNIKVKDLCMVPNRFAIAMQDAGWFVRSEIIWAKTNQMPESVKDRPATSHEKIFLFTKSSKYDYDCDAVLQPVSKNTNARLAQNVMKQIGSDRANGGKKTNGNMKAVARKQKNLDRPRPHSIHKARVKDNDSFDSALSLPVTERNLRNYEPAPITVWNLPTARFSGAHFATFPPDLAERCIKAGCPEGGIVLDIFGGAGTTGLVADRLQREAILIELNPEYAAIAQRRIDGDRGELLDVMESSQ